MTSQIMNIVKFIPAIIGSVTLTVNAASFDCGKAGTNIEKQICASVQLNQLDEDLARKYKILMASIDDGQKNALIKDQKSWLAQRNSCTNSACIEEAYKSRIKDFCKNTVLSRLDECRASDNVLTGTHGRDSSLGFEATSPQLNKSDIDNEPRNAQQITKPTHNQPNKKDIDISSTANLHSNFRSYETGQDLKSKSQSSQLNNTQSSLNITNSSVQPQSPFDNDNKNYQPSSDRVSVIATGIGDSPQSAARNAIENALMQVVGTFIDSETILKKRTEISGAIREMTSSIDVNILQYSQGSVENFELLQTTNDGGLIRVTAKVLVKNNELNRNVKTAIGGSLNLNPGVFAQLDLLEDRRKDRLEIIKKDIIYPIRSWDNVELKMYPPFIHRVEGIWREAVTRSNFPIDLNEAPGFGIGGQQHAKCSLSGEEVIAIPFTLSILDTYSQSFENIMNEISDNKFQTRDCSAINKQRSSNRNENSLCIAHHTNYGGWNSYIFNDLTLSKIFSERGPYFDEDFSVIVELKDDNGATTWKDNLLHPGYNGFETTFTNCSFKKSNTVAIINVNMGDYDNYPLKGFASPTMMELRGNNITIFKNGYGVLILDIPKELRSKTSQIKISAHIGLDK